MTAVCVSIDHILCDGLSKCKWRGSDPHTLFRLGHVGKPSTRRSPTVDGIHKERNKHNMGDNWSNYRGSSGNRQVVHDGKQGDKKDIRPGAWFTEGGHV